MTTRELINQALSLPIEERALIVDSILRSLNAPEEQVDEQWIQIAKKRREELRLGKVSPVDGEEVFSKIRTRYGG